MSATNAAIEAEIHATLIMVARPGSLRKKSLLSRIITRLRTRSALTRLQDTSPHLLADIGLSGYDVMVEFRRPWFQI
ncbi:hypothetical protein ACFSM5_03610 [Lacibacterium aquatile]|uniref:DUF1127 domain-containing protein n=1 Tax=Lacibacterium aquatile TaxID=1168082 RepID=A0ABW5DN42_9PROT